ncbi:hypothetical protein J3R83DRAFT_1142 [Lanmaoa asiatica]|nr:hypothetical protein J3R83DRAFT_1142 [Lanmaoa asiatica]
MESYISILFSLLERPTNSKFAMQAVLDDIQPLTPRAWRDLLIQLVPASERHYVVTDVSRFKKGSLFPNYQHEFIVLVAHPNPTRPAEVPIAIQVSRSIRGNVISARLGLWGPADDTVTVLSHSYKTPHEVAKKGNSTLLGLYNRS